MVFNKKGISPVVATALLIVVAVVAVVGFSSWFGSYQSNINSNLELDSKNSNGVSIEAFRNNNLYIKTNSRKNLSLIKIVDSKGNKICEFSGTDNINSTGLVGWWTFDEIINNSGTLILPDLSGNNNYGILNDSNFSNSDGLTYPKLVKSRLGNALEFDGIDDYIEINDSNSLDINGSISFFILLEFKGINTEYILNKRNLDPGSSSGNYKLGLDLNNFYFNYQPESISDKFGSALDYNNRNLNFIYFSYIFSNESSIRYMPNYNYHEFNWLEGKEGNESVITNNYSLVIGSLKDAANNLNYFFKGQIDEIRIYNRTLTNDEVKILYWYSIRSLKEGLNQIDLSSCNLIKGNKYELIVLSKIDNIEYNFIAK